MGEDAEWEQMKRESVQWPTEVQYVARQQHIKARGYPRGIEWAYQKSDAPADASAVIDFTHLVPPCLECGAAGYVWFAPDGLMQIRYECGHVPARDEDDD